MVALKIGSSLHKMKTWFIYHYINIILMGITLLFALCQTLLIFGGGLDDRIFILLFLFSIC